MNQAADDLSSVHRADTALRAAIPNPVEDMDWADYDALVKAMQSALGTRPPVRTFGYEHPTRLQDPEIGVGKPYSTRLAYYDFGDSGGDSGGDGEPVIAIGGITNVAQRFDFFALDAAPALRVIGLDLAGRGHSGWLAELSDYHLDGYVEQLRQFMDHLGLTSCTMLGSSLGGSTILRLAALEPQRVRRIILNDSAPYIPLARRMRRAKAAARHYVFRNPTEMFRRIGAATKYSGPAPDAALLHSAHHKTRWSEEEDGRIYRHDLRALLAYRADADHSLDLWAEWATVKCPVLLIHGADSDATTLDTIDKMRSHDGLSVLHVPDTGHTPTLTDRPLIEDIVAWTLDDRPFDKDRTRTVAAWPKRMLYVGAESGGHS